MMSTYEPPLVESVLLKWSHRPVIVGKRLHGDIEPPHGGVIESLTRSEKAKLYARDSKATLPM